MNTLTTGKLTFFLLLLVSSVQSQIKEFEEAFGVENTMQLNHLVTEFETYTLATLYPKIAKKDRYKKLLEQISKMELLVENIPLKTERKIFHKSKLKMQIYCIADSVWIGNSKYGISNNKKKVIVTKYKCLTTEGNITSKISETYSYRDKEETFEMLKHQKRDVLANFKGSYYYALKKVSAISKNIASYIDVVSAMGDFPNSILLAETLFKGNDNLNDYFIKRIILTNIIYRYT